MKETKEPEFIKFKLMSIDAIRDYDNSWQWNNQFTLEDDIYIGIDCLTNRKILKMLREWNYLTDYSKGRLEIEDVSCFDHCYEIRLKGTKEPFLCLSAIH